MIRTLLLLFCLGSTLRMAAQAPAPCGTVTGRNEWLKNYQHNPAAYRKDMDSLLFLALTVHLTGSDGGAGYFPASNLVDALCRLNADFLQAGIQFFVEDAAFRYIPNSAWDSHSHVLAGAAMMFANNVPNTLNCYIVTDAAGNCGYNLPYAGIALAKSCNGINSHTWAHEAGHALGLPHPFLGWEGGVSHNNSVPHNFSNPAPEFVTYDYTYFKDTLILDTLIIDTAWVELADGSNCQIAADGFCDTGSDYLANRWTCNSTMMSAQSQTDPAGVAFRSDGTLIMSYSNDVCQSRFTDEQIETMRAFVFDRRPNWLSTQAPAQAVGPPPALLFPVQGEPAPYNSTRLRWAAVPHAGHYIVQVSRLPNFGVRDEFVIPDTTLLLNELLVNRTYYWRVRPFNSHNFCTLWSGTANFTTAVISDTDEAKTARPSAVFPNPVRNGETVMIRGAEGMIFYELFSPLGIRVAGGEVEAASGIRIPMDLAPGLYYLAVRRESGQGIIPVAVMR